MILSDLRSYLRNRRRVALSDLVNHFAVEPDALRGMLSKWIAKGNLRKLSVDSNCGTSCCKCDPALTELYEWIEKPGV